MKTAPLLFCLLCCLRQPLHAETLEIPLQKLTPLPSMELKCVNDTRDIQVPVPERWTINSLTLNLRYTVSNNLLGDVSQLIVRINDTPIAQTKLNPIAPEVRLSVSIPVNLLKPGYNTLGFQVSQHFSRKECEAPCAPDLWTHIQLAESSLKFDYSMKPLPLALSAVSDFVFDPKLLPHGEIHLITENASSELLTVAGVVASGIARRFDYRKVKFSVSQELRPEVDNVLIGRRAFVQGFLRRYGLDAQGIEAGYLKILHLPGADGKADPRHALLLVSGEKLEDVKIAAETFANISFPYPGSDALKAYEFNLPDITQYSGRLVLTPDKTYDLKTLNFPTHSFTGFNPSAFGVTFRLPADFLIKQNQYAKLALNFSYGAGMRSDSVLNLAVNGTDVRAIHLDNAGGAFIEGYKIDIPTYVFKPGTNTISFTPSLHPPGQVCDMLLADSLFLTLYDNSTLYFPPMPHLVELPKLELFMLNGFPFTRWPDGFESLIYLPQADNQTIAAALDLVGLITQKNGFPLFGIQIGFDQPKDWHGELIVIGKPGAIPDELKERAPLTLAKVSRVPYPVIRGWEDESTLAFSKQLSSLGPGRGMMMEFQSPYTPGRSVMLLTAENNSDLLGLSEALLDPAVQGAASGDFVLVDLTTAPDYKAMAYAVGEKYTTGKKGSVSPLDAFLYAHTYVFYGLIALVMLALTGALYFAVRRYRAQRRRQGGQTPT